MADYYENDNYGIPDEMSRPVARCVYCGKGIFKPDQAMVINTNKNTIHMECWEDYAAENYEEFLSGLYE